MSRTTSRTIESPGSLPERRRPALRLARQAALVALGFLAAAPPVRSQSPKVGGDAYVDDTDLGFKVKVPKDWVMIPPRPGEDNLIAVYQPESDVYLDLSSKAKLNLRYWIVKFDRRDGKPQPEADDAGQRVIVLDGAGVAKDIDGWLKGPAARFPDLGIPSPWKRSSEKDIKFHKISGQEYEYDGLFVDAEVKLYVAILHLRPEVDVGVVGIGPGGKKWRKYENVYSKLAKTIDKVKLREVDRTARVAGADTPLRQKKRAELQAQIARTSGWKLYESPNYFIVSNSEDEQFIDEVIERIEAIRQVFVRDFPPEDVKALRQRAAAAAAARRAEEGGGDQPEERSVAREDPMEVARTSVLRICKDREQYLGYGAPGMSVGYWSSAHKELVLYDGKKTVGRSMTWATLSHEAFHQYIYYFYGNIAPHSWYNEGTGDYYGGFEFKGGKFRPGPDDNNRREIQEMIRKHRPEKPAYAPLDELVRMTQAEYYGGNKYGIGGFSMYSEGWSFIWFLRTGKKKARGWNDDWDGILDTYLETLAVTQDLDEAVDKAFAGVDWEEMTECWLRYTK